MAFHGGGERLGLAAHRLPGIGAQVLQAPLHLLSPAQRPIQITRDLPGKYVDSYEFADGRLEFMGRLDLQVKVRGFRVEPGEVEHALSSLPGVREARVIVREDAPGDRRLVAYVAGGAEVDDLRAHLRRTLPEYMVPQAFVRLDRLPLTPNGKLDRKALPAPELASAEERYVAPRTPVEEVLGGIWAEVLNRERVGVHDSFFALGGHSLLIMRLLAEIKATFDLEISIRTVFSMPTVEAMAAEIERMIYEDVSTMSEFEAQQLAESNPVAGV